MYTTIRMLQTNNACIPGFTRTVSFFGTGNSMRDVPIPLWVLCLTNNSSDFTWALENACVIDHTMYQQFRERTLLHYFHQRYFRSERSVTNVKNQAAKLAIEEAATLETYEQVVQYLDKYKDHILSGNSWFSELHKMAWSSPQDYIHSIWNNFMDPAPSRFLRTAIGKKHSALYPEGALSVNHFRVTHGLTSEEGFAAIVLGHSEVYTELLKFVVDHSVFSRRRRTTGQLLLEQTAPGKFSASMSVEDPKSVFMVLRLLTMQNATKIELLEQIHDSFNTTAEGLDSSLSAAGQDLPDLGDPDAVAEVRQVLEAGSRPRAASRRRRVALHDDNGEEDEDDDN